MTSKDKLQYLLITTLFKDGKVELVLPDGMTVQLGITEETKHGLKKNENYCSVVVSQEDKTFSMDAYNMSLQYNRDRLIFEEENSENCILEVI